MNSPWHGIAALYRKEVRRFMKVTVQTVLTPVITALLYLLVFDHVLADHVEIYPGHGYGVFLIPGLIMMSVIQNAFANSSSSLIQSKMNGNIVFLLLSPISPAGTFLAFVAAAVSRGLLVGLGVWLVTVFWFGLPLNAPWWILVFAILGSAVQGGLGLIAGIWADNYDQMAAFQNFVILPLSFLSGVFYSIHSLPGIWVEVSRFNPFFYMIDGFRHGFLGVSDVDPFLSLAVVSTFLAVISAISIALLSSGYKLRG